MRQDNKILISAVLILGVALVAFNFGGLSGRVPGGLKVTCIDPQITAKQIGSEIEVTITEPEKRGPYGGINSEHKDEIFVRENNPSKALFERVNIPKTLRGEDLIKFRFRPTRPIESGYVGVKGCGGEEVMAYFS